MENKSPISQKVRITAYVLFFLLFLLATLFAGEFYARSKPEYGRAGYAFCEDLIYHLNPNLVAQKPYAAGRVGEDPFTLRFNNIGIRGEDISAKPQEGTKRVLVLGDSYTAGLDYPEEVTYVHQWIAKLNAESDTKYEVVNASCPAWGTDQQYLFWEKYGRNLNPDYVVIMMSPNDIREAWNHNIVRYNTELQELTTSTPEIPSNERRGWYLASKSSLYQLMQKKFFNSEYGNFLRVFWHFPVNYGIQDSTDWDMPLFLKDPFPAVDSSYQLLEKIYTNIQQKCEESGAEFHLVKIPIRLEIDSTYQDTLVFNNGIVEQRLSEIAKRNDIPFHNLNERLRQHPDGNDIFMDWEHHYDEDGHNWMAEQLFQSIKF